MDDTPKGRLGLCLALNFGRERRTAASRATEPP